MTTTLAAAALAVALSTPATVKTAAVAYADATGAALNGVVAWDDATKNARPGVVVVPDWMGVTPRAEQTARDLAALGYVAFVADVYGQGVRPTSAKEAGALAGRYKGDRALLKKRVQAALVTLVKNPLVDATKTAAIGFCFGGTAALELGRAGAPLRGIVSFHGGLDAATPGDGKNIQARVLALHGADDPFVPAADIAAWKADLNAAHVDWQLVEYADTVHSFTNPEAGTDKSKGAAWNERSARRAWAAMRAFFDEIFADAAR